MGRHPALSYRVVGHEGPRPEGPPHRPGQGRLPGAERRQGADRQFLVGGEWNWWTVRHDQVKSISLDGIALRDESSFPTRRRLDAEDRWRDLLDQQIIDAKGRKVVRVNDVTFELKHGNHHDELRVLEVDVGMRSIFRRLCQGIVPPRAVRPPDDGIAPNSNPLGVLHIIEPDPQRRLRLKIDMKALESIHPADLADIVEELSHEDREAVFESSTGGGGRNLSEVEDTKTQAGHPGIPRRRPRRRIVEEMSPDEAAERSG